MIAQRSGGVKEFGLTSTTGKWRLLDFEELDEKLPFLKTIIRNSGR